MCVLWGKLVRVLLGNSRIRVGLIGAVSSMGTGDTSFLSRILARVWAFASLLSVTLSSMVLRGEQTGIHRRHRTEQIGADCLALQSRRGTAMANKQSFTPEEWTKILESPMVAGIAVSAAEPSGLWGSLKEAFASSSALASAKLDAGSNELVRAVAAAFETAEGRSDLQKALRQRFADAEPVDCPAFAC